MFQLLTVNAFQKTPGNDSITREFYIAFFDLIKDLLMSSINYSWEVGELSTS